MTEYAQDEECDLVDSHDVLEETGVAGGDRHDDVYGAGELALEAAVQ